MFPAEPIPAQLGSYKVVRRLSVTGSITTYLGRMEGPMGFARDCVLKLMADTSEGSVRFAEELAREAAICSQMSHPNIVRMFDFFEQSRHLVLVLEHIEGVTLAELVQDLAEKNKKLSDAAIYAIGHQIAGALNHAHGATDERGRSAPIVHRNVHPGSILVGLDGRVRLTEFGVGKILGRSPNTAIGTVKGRPGYMAPEQARGEAVTPKTDVFLLGLLLWSLFTGKQPPSDGTAPARVGSLRPELPREILAMIDAALNRLPATRKLTAREMEQWLGKVVPADKGKDELRDEVARYREEHPVKPADEEDLPRLEPDVDEPTRELKAQRIPPAALPTPDPSAAAGIAPAVATSASVSGEAPQRVSSPGIAPIRASSPGVAPRASSPSVAPRASSPSVAPRASSPGTGVAPVNEAAPSPPPPAAAVPTAPKPPPPPRTGKKPPPPPRAGSKPGLGDAPSPAGAASPPAASASPQTPSATPQPPSATPTPAPPAVASNPLAPMPAEASNPLAPMPAEASNPLAPMPAEASNPLAPMPAEASNPLAPIPDAGGGGGGGSGSGVRFGPPPPGLPPAPPLPPGARKADWRQSLPDVDNLDQLFEAAKAPRNDSSRSSTPGLPPAAPATAGAPDASAGPTAPAKRPAGSPGAAAGDRAAGGPQKPATMTLLGLPAAPVTINRGSDVPAAPSFGAPAAPSFGVAAPSFGAPPAPPPAPSAGPPPAGPPPPPAGPSAPATEGPSASAGPPPLATPASVPASTAPPQARGSGSSPALTEGRKSDAGIAYEATMSAIPFEVLDEGSRPPMPPTAPVGLGLTPAPAVTAAPPKIDTLPPPPDEPTKQRLTLPWKAPRPAARMSMGVVIGVSAVTATVVVLGLYFFLRSTAPNGPTADGSAAASALSAPTAAVATSTTPRAVTTSGAARPRPAAPPAPTPAPTSAASTSAPAATSAPAPTSAPGGEPSVADLPLGYGYLVVDNGAPADVYISGRLVGPTSQQLKVMCGRWFARLATPGGGKSPEWVSPGMTVTVPCQGLTRVDFRAAKPTKKR